MLDQYKFVVVEDNEENQIDVLTRLADAGFSPDNKLGVAGTYAAALEMIQQGADEIDVVFLDLNLPRDERDSRPEKRHGHELLKLIHGDINQSSLDRHVRVVIVSGEELDDGVQYDLFMERYAGTLVSIASKAALEKTLRASIKRLRKDPLLARIKKCGLPIVEQYEKLFDASQSVLDRVSAAKSIAICIVRAECQHHAGSLDAHEVGDDLNRLIKDGIEARFEEDRGRRRVKRSGIESDGGWGAFVWRGPMVQHLYTLNQYRNHYVHIDEQPLRSPDGDSWTIPDEVMSGAEQGTATSLVVGAIVKDLLSWYLPWYEQVYLPWKEAQS